MARSIVLRFDATCFDCGASLSAGTTARWFGKGRVSCCGDQYRNRAAATSFVPDAASAPAPLAVHSAPVTQLARDVGIPPEALAAGLNPVQLTTLAEKAPHTRLVVRLSSGARFIVPAVHAHHVIRCVGESMIDRIRDVALLAEGSTL